MANTDPFNLSSASNRNSFGLTKTSDIRSGFNTFISRRPNWMLYVRADQRYPCPLGHDPASRSPEVDCQKCFGLGFEVQYEKHAVRRVIVANQAQEQIEQFGYLAKYKTVIYTPRYYYPKAKDLYLEVEWSTELAKIEQYGKPTKLINAYQIDEAISFREDEISYFSAACDTYNFTAIDIDNWIKQLGSVYTPKRVI